VNAEILQLSTSHEMSRARQQLQLMRHLKTILKNLVYRATQTRDNITFLYGFSSSGNQTAQQFQISVFQKSLSKISPVWIVVLERQHPLSRLSAQMMRYTESFLRLASGTASSHTKELVPISLTIQEATN